MNNDFNILVQKLNRFVRKYYKNLILKGIILSFSIVLALFLLADVIEYFAWTSIIARTIIFYLFIASVLVVLVGYVIIPGLKLARIGKTISDSEAAKLIGEHFPDVSDKLLNTLQLGDLIENGSDKEEYALLEASIEQRAASLNPIPFRKAIDMRKNVKYLRYFAPPFIIILAVLIVSPAFITEPSKRLVNHTTYFEKPLPYSLAITNDKLEALQHDDFVLKLMAEGEEIPAKVQVKIGNYTYRMQESKPGNYEYTFKDLNGDVYFEIVTESYSSEDYHLKVFPKPVIFSFDIELDYPDYLQRKKELVENSGDIVVPEGTDLLWNIFTKDAVNVHFRTDKNHIILTEKESNVYKHQEKANRNFYYSLMADNENVAYGDSLNFSVQIIKDEYPSIIVNEHMEESIYGFAHFNGSITDDHGFRSLKVYHRINDTDDSEWVSSNLTIDNNLNRQYFNHSVQAVDYNLSPGESMSYYFEVRDNDAVNGYKRSKSPVFQLVLPDVSELEESIEETSDKIKEQMKDALKELERLNEEIEEAQMSLFEKKELNWLDKKQLAELLKKEENLQKKISELNEMNEEINQIEDFLEKQNDAALEEKLAELQEMLEELADEDLEKQLEELQKLLEDIDKDQLNKQLENIKKNNEDLMSSLEQNLELYKQLEFEKKIKETADKLEELAKEQQELAEQTGEKEIDEKESLEKQEQNKEEFSEIEKDLEKAEELNQELEEPFDVNADQESMDEINQEMDNASGDLQKGKQKKASKSQKSAGDKMEKMASDLNMMMAGAMQSRMAEDAEMIKRMLDNLLDLSFSTETLMADVAETSQNDPSYIDNIDQLKLLQDDFSIVHDSLIALSKRQLMVKPFIINESDQVITYMDRSLNSLQGRKKGKAIGEQQYAMTSMNNLALMLAESLEQMQMSMSMSGSGPGQECPMPGQGQPQSMDEMSKMQQQLNQGMQQGMGENGPAGEGGLNGDSERLTRMAEMQSEIRRQLQNYIKELESQGGSGNALNKLIEEMKRSEDDIINRRITQETLERQKQIEVRLLKSEKAEQEREKDKKRESSIGKDRKRSNLNLVLEYKDTETVSEEILITEPIEMTPYYRDLLKKYLYNLEKENAK